MELTRIAVSETLSNVSQYLSDQGYDVITFNQTIPNEQIDAAILSGENENMLGMMEEGKFPIINAEGLTATEVFEQLQKRITLQ